MESGDPFALPHGARGIDAGELALMIGVGKLVLIPKSRTEHYTLQSGAESGVLDIHRTWKDEYGRERHQTVFAIRHEDLAGLLNELGWLPSEFLKLSRSLRIGWLARNKIAVVRGVDPVTTEDIAAVTTRKRKQRLVVDEEKWRTRLNAPEYLDDVWDFPDGAFTLFSGNRRIGVGFKVTDQFGTVRLRWVKIRDLNRCVNVIGQRVIDTALCHSIPPERYRDYSDLER